MSAVACEWPFPHFPCAASVDFRLSERREASFREAFLRINVQGVAQLGRAIGLGPIGRWFESSHPDFAVFGIENEGELGNGRMGSAGIR